MKTVLGISLGILLAGATLASAAETEARGAIEQVIREIGADCDLGSGLVRPSVWSEVASYITIDSIRFITSDVALVDATSTQFGSTILARRRRSLIVMRKRGDNWEIDSSRVSRSAP